MKLAISALITLCIVMSVLSYQTFPINAITKRTSQSQFYMSTVSNEKEKKLPKVEGIKDRSHYLRDPLESELKTEEIYINPDAVVVLKYHGSYMQDNRDNRKQGSEKEYSFMLRLKSPAGEVTSELYCLLDDLCDKYGQHDLRLTTRQAYQIHGKCFNHFIKSKHIFILIFMFYFTLISF